MKEIFSGCEPVILSRVESILTDNEIGFVKLNQYASSIFAGALNLIPQRIMVHEDDHNDAARILRMEHIKPSSDAEGDKVRTNLRPW